jgi:cellobiose phosphorylase
MSPRPASEAAAVLALGEKRAHRPINAGSDGETQAMIAPVTQEVKRQANKTVNPVHIMVMAQDPAKPVVVMVRFDDRTHHRIQDCFALAGTDQQFAQVFVGVLAELARLSGCEVEL